MKKVAEKVATLVDRMAELKAGDLVVLRVE